MRWRFREKGNGPDGGCDKRPDELKMSQQLVFPRGIPDSAVAVGPVLEQYKIVVGAAESLAARRQSLHVFFMSINSLLLAAIGLVARESVDTPGIGVGVVALALAGAVLSGSWQRQIKSNQVASQIRWEVLGEIEAALPAEPLAAEWKVLQNRMKRGEYKSFTERETSVPTAFFALYLIAVVSGALLAAQVL